MNRLSVILCPSFYRAQHCLPIQRSHDHLSIHWDFTKIENREIDREFTTHAYFCYHLPSAHSQTTLRSEWHHDPTIASKRLADHGEERLCKTTLELRQEISSIRPSTKQVTPDGRIALAGNSSGHLGTFQTQTLNVDLHIFHHWYGAYVFPKNNR